MKTLSETYRPQTIDDIIGQEKIIGPKGIIRKMLTQKTIRSCIFYGPPGCGKTTTAQIIAKESGLPFVSLNATNAKLEDIRKIVSKKDDTSQPILLYLDEIQYFNKKQQQSLLPYIENNTIILIAATTDNPYYCCYDALLSRCMILEFHPVTSEEIQTKLRTIANTEQITINDEALKLIASNVAGDVRRAINLLDMIILQCNNNITADDIKQHLPSTNMSGFDLDGDDHFALISALQKSIRGSDPNAAIFYLARLLEAGDILSPCRRLLVIAHEDIGLGNPNAIPFVTACIEAAKQLGMPEAAKPLTNAVIYLAISKKCSTAENTYNPAANDVQAGYGGVIPKHLRHACSKGYLYPHDYPNHWVKQQYLLDDLASRVYYTPGDNEFEQSAARYWATIMSRS